MKKLFVETSSFVYLQKRNFHLCKPLQMALQSHLRRSFEYSLRNRMFRFAKALQKLCRSLSHTLQKRRKAAHLGRFSHFNPARKTLRFPPISSRSAPKKWLHIAICGEKQLSEASRRRNSHST
ncbi:hypothetical protein [Candidatus Allofournierella excrementavium]|uniref:hypothetical protein n=1 Tax=Candidatus Allofournierella excrementavium TaxID=2838591 RepID=UPI003AB50126